VAAVDLQQRGDTPYHVASAPYSVMIGGYNNRIGFSPGYYSNRGSAIVGGWNNSILGNYVHGSAIVSGWNNSINGGFYYATYGALVGGYANYVGIHASGSTVFGRGNTVQGAPGYYFTDNAFACGRDNVISAIPGVGGAYYAVAMGASHRNYSYGSFTLGARCQVYGASGFSLAGGTGTDVGYNSVGSFAWGSRCRIGYQTAFSQAWGLDAGTYVQGQTAWSAAGSSGPPGAGEAQRSMYSLSIDTTDATPANLLADALFRFLTVRNARAYGFRIMVAAYQYGGVAGTIGDCASWDITGLIVREGVGSVTTLVGVGQAGVALPAPLYNTGAAAGWTVAVSADDPTDTLRITVQGEANKDIKWHATIITSEVGQ
jgi:hypothetical protein